MNRIVKIALLLMLIFSYVEAIERSEKLFECTKIFEARKEELLVELERIDEQRQSLESLKIATDELLKKKAVKIEKREAAVEQKLAEIKSREENTKKMLEENREVLESIKNQKMDKISEVYAKMKAASAAAVLSDMNVEEAGAILNKLKPKTVGKIFSKMDAKRASELSSYISK